MNISKAYSSTLAYEVRSLLTQFLHDAIWVQKTHNMLPILDELNDEVKEQAENGQNVILFWLFCGFICYLSIFDVQNALYQFRKFIQGP